MFDKTQTAFEDLKKIVAEGTSPVYLWIGAGLSRHAGLPMWNELKTRLIEKARNFVKQQILENDQEHKYALLTVAEKSDDCWSAFDRIYEAIGDVEYSSAMVSEFQMASMCKIPNVYKTLLGIRGVKGVVTTNIDKLVSRTFAEEFSNQPIIFDGFDCSDYIYTLAGGNKFVLNLHGVYEKRSSWVMRRSELSRLQNDSGYNTFLSSLFTEKVVVFVGVNPSDEAVLTHLDRVRNRNVIKGSTPIFWITERKDAQAIEFCNKYSIRRVVYSDADCHADLKDVVRLLNESKSFDDEHPCPMYINVNKAEKSVRNFDNIDLNSLSAGDLRDVLNKRATHILESRTEAAYLEYDKFLEKHKRMIHNAWFVDVGEDVFGLSVEAKIGDGAFGRVYKATDIDGNVFAVKVLKEDVMWQPGWLQSFRRGVKAMEILTKSSIEGVVRYHAASEIPAVVTMEWIDGPDLYDVVQQKRLTNWQEKLRVLCEIGKIVKSAHALPERVLHRDLRPQNIKLEGFNSGDSWKVRVLDFDLAYHKGANEVSMQVGYGNGFSAPEQTIMSSGGSRRSSRVDSYGFAMLCYYVMTSDMPMPGQCLMNGWPEQVNKKMSAVPCKEWLSLPYKMAAMINQCTDKDQNRRLDLYLMNDLLSSWCGVLRGDMRQMTPELVLDELAYRVAVDLRAQDRLKKQLDGTRVFETVGGGVYSFSSDNWKISFEISWHNKGDREFAKVKKMLNDRVNLLVGKLRSIPYLDVGHHYEGQGVRISANFQGKTVDIDWVIQLSSVISNFPIEPRSY